MLKLGKKPDGSKYSESEIAGISLDEVKKMIEEQVPNAFAKKVKAATKKAATKKAPVKSAKK
jgi:DNA topoisomerase-1